MTMFVSMNALAGIGLFPVELVAACICIEAAEKRLDFLGCSFRLMGPIPASAGETTRIDMHRPRLPDVGREVGVFQQTNGARIGRKEAAWHIL